MSRPNSNAFFGFLPLLVLFYRVGVRAPDRSGHFIFEYSAFLLHTLMSVTDGDTTLALLPSVAVVSYLLYFSTRLHERCIHVLTSVVLVACTTDMADFSPVAAGILVGVQVIVYMVNIAPFLNTVAHTMQVLVLVVLGVVGVALTDDLTQWALRSCTYSLALLLCPTERVPIPFPRIADLVLQRASISANSEAAMGEEEELQEVEIEVHEPPTPAARNFGLK